MKYLKNTDNDVDGIVQSIYESSTLRLRADKRGEKSCSAPDAAQPQPATHPAKPEALFWIYTTGAGFHHHRLYLHFKHWFPRWDGALPSLRWVETLVPAQTTVAQGTAEITLGHSTAAAHSLGQTSPRSSISYLPHHTSKSQESSDSPHKLSIARGTVLLISPCSQPHAAPSITPVQLHMQLHSTTHWGTDLG